MKRQLIYLLGVLFVIAVAGLIITYLPADLQKNFIFLCSLEKFVSDSTQLQLNPGHFVYVMVVGVLTGATVTLVLVLSGRRDLANKLNKVTLWVSIVLVSSMVLSSLLEGVIRKIC